MGIKIEIGEIIFNEEPDAETIKAIQKEFTRLWKANNMDEQFRKAQVDLLLYGEAKIDISNIQGETQ
jgi:hypothetical protein